MTYGQIVALIGMLSGIIYGMYFVMRKKNKNN